MAGLLHRFPTASSLKCSSWIRQTHHVIAFSTSPLQLQKDKGFSIPSKPQQISDSEMSDFLGAKTRYSDTLAFRYPEEESNMKCFRLMNPKGEFQIPDYKIPFDNDTLLKMYQCMSTTKAMDEVFYDAQRQGRIAFYMTNHGEEATQVGSAIALHDEDKIYAQYREAGVLMWRGFPLVRFADQLFANGNDTHKGRQMGAHYGSAEHNFFSISSPLGTQLPQATGSAYAIKREGSKLCVMCYIGEGACSEGDFHPALNFAATLECPVIFFCRNNGYAISTRVDEQYKGDGIAARGPGYGMHTIRVDGNDIFAVYEATKAARKIAVEKNKPVLIEAMTYRVGHHSTSDDSARYRDYDEIVFWMNERSPLIRFRILLERLGIWDAEKEENLTQNARQEVLKALIESENTKLPAVKDLWTDVYHDIPPFIQEQKEGLYAHLEEHGEMYDLYKFRAD